MNEQEPSWEQAAEYHRKLPLRLRDYLNRRGILDHQIEAHLLGWNGRRITIPVRGPGGDVSQFRLARDPKDLDSAPKMLSTAGSSAELYGWEWVRMRPDRLVISEGEFDRLVLERYGFAAVTSTGGAGVFREAWAEALEPIPEIYVCFDRDGAGRKGARKVAGMIAGARIVELPEEVGDGGDVTDFFVRLGREADDFEDLLESAEPVSEDETSGARAGDQTRSQSSGGSEEVQDLKAQFELERFVRRYLPLRRQGQNWTARCPFHDDRDPSFVVFPDTQSFYCFGCHESGDLISFVQQIEDLTFPEALDVLRHLAP